jgi:SAM-dependent methyltransferase/uncharacterized protein YbaR (Trm112 family)
VGEVVKPSLLPYLVCPECHSSLTVSGESRDGEAGKIGLASTEIDSGELQCAGCSRRYPIGSGVPSFVPAADQSSHVAQSFGFEWQTFHEGGFESSTVFGRTVDEDIAQFNDVFAVPAATDSNPHDPLAGLFVVDAGCGSGKLTAEIARLHPDATVLGLDINEAIHEVYKASLELPNLHVVQASVFNLPLADGVVDRLWSNGVIHHTGDTRRAFRELARAVRSGQLLFVWVYQRKFSPLVLVRDLLRPLGLQRWSHRTIYRLSQALSFPTVAAVRLIGLLGSIPAVKRSTHGRILTRERHYDELTLTWFDVLSPRYRDTYSMSELESWFRQAGFAVVRRYWWPVGVTGQRAN